MRVVFRLVGHTDGRLWHKQSQASYDPDFLYISHICF